MPSETASCSERRPYNCHLAAHDNSMRGDVFEKGLGEAVELPPLHPYAAESLQGRAAAGGQPPVGAQTPR